MSEISWLNCKQSSCCARLHICISKIPNSHKNSVLFSEELFLSLSSTFCLLGFCCCLALLNAMTKYPEFCLCLSGNVYIQPTQDTKNPVIYGVFSVSGWVTDSLLRLPLSRCISVSSCSAPSPFSHIEMLPCVRPPSVPGYKETNWESVSVEPRVDTCSSVTPTKPIVPYRSDLIASCLWTRCINIHGKQAGV